MTFTNVYQIKIFFPLQSFLENRFIAHFGPLQRATMWFLFGICKTYLNIGRNRQVRRSPVKRHCILTQKVVAIRLT